MVFCITVTAWFRIIVPIAVIWTSTRVCLVSVYEPLLVSVFYHLGGVNFFAVTDQRSLSVAISGLMP